MKHKIAIVVPCYNEEAVLKYTVPQLLSILDRLSASEKISPESFVMCVDDGSSDSTRDEIVRLNLLDNRVKGISLAHNRGHQYALLAGLMDVKDQCDAAISIDADLQDDPEAIESMVNDFISGHEIVYGVRESRASDTWFKRTTARAFYKLQGQLGLKTVYDHADYRLMSRRALDILSEYGESNLFLRGIVPQIGLSTSIVRYDRHQRVAGESKYPLKKMLAFSVDGITSFSARPIRIIFFAGLILMLLDLLVAIYVLLSYFRGDVVSGWSSLMLSVWFLGSLILMAIGIVGEYIGKTFMEVKKRPRYDIKERIN
jgi:glycosyltransferase involved in cell wall biosynthesis